MLKSIFYFIAILFYLLSILQLWRDQHSELNVNKNPNSYLLIWLATALAAHAVHVYLTLFYFGVNLALGVMFSSIILLVSLSYYMCILLKKDHISLGLIIVPLSLIAISAGEFFPGNAMMLYSLPSGLRWHILLAIPAFIFICLAFAQSVLLIYAEKNLRKPMSGKPLLKLPALDSMDNFLHWLIMASFILININIALGILAVIKYEQNSSIINHHFIFVFLSWICLLILLIGRRVSGWRNSIAGKWTISAFVLLLLAYFGTRFVTQVFLT